MTTLLLANNAVLLRALSRKLGKMEALTPIIVHTPDWLLGTHTVPRLKAPLDFALLDCSATDSDSQLLIELLCTRFSPKRWLLMASSGDARSMRHAVRLGVGGCLHAPASAELVCAAMGLVHAGGECFPRPGPAWDSAVGTSSLFPGGSTAMG
jgi:DNA-binding NarL/FixJ family response regulator